MWRGRGGKKGLYIVTERFHCPRLPSISNHNRPFGGGGAPWQRPLTPGQSKHDSSLKYTDTTERRPTRGLTRTQKRTLCHPGADWCQRLGWTPGLSLRLLYCCWWRWGGFGRRITLHYLRRSCNVIMPCPSMKSLPFAWTTVAGHWGQIGGGLEHNWSRFYTGGTFPSKARSKASPRAAW